jgi:uncharacterized coiled-coil protein SlyX
MSEERLIRLERALAHQDAQISDLSAMVSQQWRDIDLLKNRLDRALHKLKEVEAHTGPAEGLSVSDAAAMEKPPHY